MQRIEEIYRPIAKEMREVEELIEHSLKNSDTKLARFLLESPGKRIRPALTILSGMSLHRNGHSVPSITPSIFSRQLTTIAAGIELIHMASLVHDDVIDHSSKRHNRPTINSRWGQDAAISFGDYIYSLAFDLIATAGNIDILQCISSATKALCEGELIQVCERGNMDLLMERYMLIIKKKTAFLFSASCQVGTLILKSPEELQNSLRDYGLNIGISFQIADDYLDIVADEKELGKIPGQDIETGEITLPLLNILESIPHGEREVLKTALLVRDNKDALRRIRSRLSHSNAGDKTKEAALFYIDRAKEKIKIFPPSPYKDSLLRIGDFFIERGFDFDDKS